MKAQIKLIPGSEVLHIYFLGLLRRALILAKIYQLYMKLVNDCLNIIANTELTTSDSEMTMHIISTCELDFSVHKWCSNTNNPLLADPSHTSPHFRVKYKDFLVLAVSLTGKYRCMIPFLGENGWIAALSVYVGTKSPPLHCLFLLKIFISGVLIPVDLHVGHVSLFRGDGLVNLHETLTVWVGAVPAPKNHDAHHHGHH